VGDVAYITLNRRSAKRIIWRALLDINEQFKLGGVPDNTELTLTLPNKNQIHVSGAKDESEIEKFRGVALRKIYIDEVQSFRSYIEQLIDEVLEPALTDYDGSLILIGTPGPIPAGYFYKACHSKGWSHHKWTLHDNPWIKIKSGKDVETIIEERCERRGIQKSDPSIRREYYGEWVEDTDSLVYKFNKQLNVYRQAPTELQYIFGIDIGWKDSDAIAVLGFSQASKHVYLVEEFVADKLTITDLAEKIRELEAIYKPTKMVMDAGALGKKIQEEIRQRHQLPVHAAEKSRKLEFIELMNDDLRTGKLLAYEGSRFEEDSYRVQWDYSTPGRPRVSDAYHTDIGDAILYAWRECRHFLYEEPIPQPKPGTDSFMDALEAKEAEKLRAKIAQAREEEQEHTGWSDEHDPWGEPY
jgi:hypothetical protein